MVLEQSRRSPFNTHHQIYNTKQKNAVQKYFEGRDAQLNSVFGVTPQTGLNMLSKMARSVCLERQTTVLEVESESESSQSDVPQ